MQNLQYIVACQRPQVSTKTHLPNMQTKQPKPLIRKVD